jgi:hypothetical protein
MTTQDLATQALARWNELRAKGIAPRERLDDPEIIKLERELAAIRQCIERRT